MNHTLRIFCTALLTAAIMGASAARAEDQDHNTPADKDIHLRGPGISQLHQFIENTRQAQGKFTQTVFPPSGTQPQISEGSFAFSRPGRFRWEYTTPFPQLLVSDGKTLWIWDRDLNQVTIQPLHDALDTTPAAILVGGEDLEKTFILAELGDIHGISWVQAIPRHAENSSFESIRIGLRDNVLQQMELKDHFGQLSQIVFTALDTDTPQPDSRFTFTPPEGADILGNAPPQGNAAAP